MTSTSQLPAIIALVCAATGGATVAQAQTSAAVTGIVTDMRGLPLAGAHVQLTNTQARTVTNEEGRFTLKTSVRPLGKTLLVSHLGMLARRVRITTSDTLRIQLE
ncbi:MAG: carboxypeptidase-like regulatory domain-containing protein, partial [Prevotellaceae bacterium]|nr:carboxypeptidase-like regulatory domain-containing protein [Prevotellaceae bacterium]